MKIGVVCEGQTDFIAIKAFIEAEFKNSGRDIIVELIQPALDNTLPSGWSQVLYWLENNKKPYRSSSYMKGNSLFAVEDEDLKFDALLFQIDSDIIGEPGFERFIANRKISYPQPVTPVDRGNVISSVLLALAEHNADCDALASREVVCPIVESSETWVIAAEGIAPDAESLNGQSLINAFGAVVARLNNKKVKSTYTSINKKVKTRIAICNALAAVSTPAGKSHHYDTAVAKLLAL